MPRQQGYRASTIGKVEIHQAVERKLLAAIGKFDGLRSNSTNNLVCGKFRISEKVWQNFVDAKRNIDRETFRDLCDWLGLDWRRIVDTSQTVFESDEPFYGRKKELDDLEDWVKNPNCRMVTVHGFEGMGKSSLVRELRERVSGHFPDRFKWVAFSYDEPVVDTLRDLLQVIDSRNLSLDRSLEQTKRQFREQLTQQRYLIVLEQVPNDSNSRYDDYRNWLSELLEYRGRYHSSCIF